MPLGRAVRVAHGPPDLASRLSNSCRGFAFLLLALLPIAAWCVGDTSDIVVRVRKDGATISVDVECPIAATRAAAWEVLTDYDNMSKFISNLDQSVVRIRTGNHLLVYQKGKASRGPLTFPFENVRDIELVPEREIRSRMTSGDAMPAEFATRIEERGAKLYIVHTGKYTPKTWVPPIVGPALIEDETRKQYGEIRDEILRRERGK
jgi:polyketide cyclase/dehydrase/lipid transport protein